MKRYLSLGLLLAAAACSSGGQSSEPNPATLAAQAVQASLTAAASAQPSTSTPEPAPAIGTQPPPAPIETAPPLGPDLCAYDLLFLTDLTVPDGAQFAPGEAFDKRWKVQNVGTCAWGPDFRIVLVDGNALGAATDLALFPALPEAEGLVRALMIAPAEPGDYAGTWSARDPAGNLFGNKMWVRITVTGE